MLRRFARVCLLWLVISMLSMTFAPAVFAHNTRTTTPKAQGSALALPGIDPHFIYQQLFYMVTHFQQRESGYSTEPGNGHDGFAKYWSQEMVSLLGDYGARARNDTFPIQGWRGRPTTTPAVNVEVTVPGILHPEQVVVIGCHYDGMAFSSQSANDDGSGCAIELGVAKAMSEFWHANHLYPARTLRFVIFDTEEQGLFGSFHYVNSTVNGDLKNIVAMFNEEQNGIAYPLRYLGSMSNPLMPFYIDMTPLKNNDLYAQQNQLSTQQQANIRQFRQLMQQAVIASFQQFRALGDQMLTYHNTQGQDVWQPIFTQDNLSYIHQEDDTLGSSDQVPFTLAGLPCATFVGNSTYYDNNAPAGSYPFDQPQDTIQLMNTFADGNSQQSQALTLALALPGMLTTWMLSQPAILGQVAADNQPIAAISSIGLSQPGQAMSFDAGASYDPGAQNSRLSYHWSFGDGSSADGQKVSHTYGQPGNYTLSLSVTSSSGGTRVIAKQLSIAQPTVYPNLYAGHQSNGTPRTNSGVILPTPVSGLSDRVGTSADAQRAGPIKQAVTPTPAQANGPSPLLWVGLAIVLVLLALLVIRIRRKRAPIIGERSDQ